MDYDGVLVSNDKAKNFKILIYIESKAKKFLANFLVLNCLNPIKKI